MRVSDSIHIAAPPGRVWAITVDVERWPQWTPTVTAVRRRDAGPLRLGSVTSISQPLQPTSDWTVTGFTDGQRFAWETRRTGMQMTGTHELMPEAGGTRCTLHLDARGPLALLLWPLLAPAIRRALSRENHGLKARAERGA